MKSPLRRARKPHDGRLGRTRWLGAVHRVYLETGRLLEKYAVAEFRSGVGGEYATQDGFWLDQRHLRDPAQLLPGRRRYEIDSDIHIFDEG
nr:trehalase family glycosidase [Rhodoferax sp.]